MRKLLLLSSVCGVAALAPAAAGAQVPPAPPQLAPEQTLMLDLYERRNDGFAGPLRMKRLANRIPYVLTVKGTGSFYRYPAGRSCGRPERRPQFASPGRRNLRVGLDPEFGFANLKGLKLCPVGAFRPRKWNGLQLSVGGKFFELVTLGAPSTAPSADHAYRYPVRGIGTRPRIRVRDRNARDNYGRFQVEVRRAVASDCLGGNHAQFGYADEATCVAAAAPDPAPAAPAPAAPVPPPAG